MSNLDDSIISVESNYMIDTAIDQEIQRLGDSGENGIVSVANLHKTPAGHAMIVSSRKMFRIGTGLRNKMQSPDALDRKIIVTMFDANDAHSLYDGSVRDKIQDVVFPFKEIINAYGPLSDIQSNNMKLIVTDEVSERMEDSRIDIDILDEELGEIHNEKANQEQEDLSRAVDNYRREVESLIRMMGACRQRILSRYPDWNRLPEDIFIHKCATGIGPDCAEYLKMEEKRRRYKQFIDTYATQVVSSALPKIFIPDHIGINTLRFPSFNQRTRQFDQFNLTIDDVQEIANRNINDQPIEIVPIPDLDEDLVRAISSEG